jgi:NADH-quinone oxidoreductase subunit N
MNSIILLSILGIGTLFTGILNWRKLILPIVIFGLAVILVVNFCDWNGGPDYYSQYRDMLNFDRYAVAFIGALIAITIMIFFLAHQHYASEESHIADIYGLMIFTLIGGAIMCSYNNLSMLFLGIEILSISLYILAGSKKSDLASNEASLKYFLMGSFSTGFLLFGIALIYGVTNTFNLEAIRQYIDSHAALPMMFNLGLVLMLVGLTFKVSAAPFHFWTPDVYQGSPTLITTFMATVVKTAGFAALFKLLYTWFGTLTVPRTLFDIIWMICALTITIGNLSAVYQKGVKRMLAYSSISNAGYLLIAVLALNVHSASSIYYYAIVYSIATILAFAVLMLVIDSRGADDYHAFAGLARNNPLLAGVMSIAMLSLAGIPPLAGFFGKYYLFITSIESSYIWIVIIAVINSLIGIFYYFRVMITLFSKEPAPKIYVKGSYQAVLIVGSLILLLLGIFPDLLTGLLR